MTHGDLLSTVLDVLLRMRSKGRERDASIVILDMTEGNDRQMGGIVAFSIAGPRLKND